MKIIFFLLALDNFVVVDSNCLWRFRWWSYLCILHASSLINLVVCSHLSLFKFVILNIVGNTTTSSSYALEAPRASASIKADTITFISIIVLYTFCWESIFYASIIFPKKAKTSRRFRYPWNQKRRHSISFLAKYVS